MISLNEITKIFDAILSAPGMNEPVKISLTMARKNVLMLTKIIERGLNPKDDQATSGLLTAIGNDALPELQGVADEMLRKAGLTDINDKLNSFSAKQ